MPVVFVKDKSCFIINESSLLNVSCLTHDSSFDFLPLSVAPSKKIGAQVFFGF